MESPLGYFGAVIRGGRDLEGTWLDDIRKARPINSRFSRLLNRMTAVWFCQLFNDFKFSINQSIDRSIDHSYY